MLKNKCNNRPDTCDMFLHNNENDCILLSESKCPDESITIMSNIDAPRIYKKSESIE
jgi:hypothetical protein